MMNILNPKVSTLQTYAGVLCIFEIMQLIRYFSLAEPIQTISPMLGPSPDKYMIRAFFMGISILAFLRLTFFVRPCHPNISSWNAYAHVAECLPISYMYYLNVLTPALAHKNGIFGKLVEDPKLAPSITIYFIILYNGFVFWRHHSRVAEGLVVSRATSLASNRKENALSREPSIENQLRQSSVLRGRSIDGELVSPPSAHKRTGSKKTTKIVKKKVVKSK